MNCSNLMSKMKYLLKGKIIKIITHVSNYTISCNKKNVNKIHRLSLNFYLYSTRFFLLAIHSLEKQLSLMESHFLLMF